MDVTRTELSLKSLFAYPRGIYKRIFLFSAISVWTCGNNNGKQIYARLEINEFSNGVGGHADTRLYVYC